MTCCVPEFAHECLKRIFSLYSKRPDPPKTVVLEGHSMVSLCDMLILSSFLKYFVS